MDQCSSAILSMAAPIVLLNFGSTLIALIVSRYIDRVLWSPSKQSQVPIKNTSTESETEEEESEEEESDIEEEESEESTEQDSETEGKQDIISDSDIIASAREGTNKVEDSNSLPMSDAEMRSFIAIVQNIASTVRDPRDSSNTHPEQYNDLETVIMKMANIVKNEKSTSMLDLMEKVGAGVIVPPKPVTEEIIPENSESEYLMQTLKALQ